MTRVVAIAALRCLAGVGLVELGVFSLESSDALAIETRPSQIDRVAAVVNDDVITLSEVYDLGGTFIEERVTRDGPTSRRAAEIEVLDSLVERRLITQEINRLSLDVTEEELRRTIADIARSNGLDEAQLRVEIERGGLTWAAYQTELRESLRQRKFTQAVILPRISVKEDELKDAWRRLTTGADQPYVNDLGAIFLAWPKIDEGADADAARAEVLVRAEAARQRVLGGEPFAAVAVEVDEGPYKAQSGKMGSFHTGELVPELDTPMRALEVGGVTEPIATEHGVFLLSLLSRHAEDPPPFEDMREQLEQQVYAGRVDEELAEWVASARRRSAVTIKLEPASGVAP